MSKNDDRHSFVYRVYSPKTWTTGVVLQDFSTKVNDIEASALYFTTVTSHYNEIRVDFVELKWVPSPAFVFNTQLSPLPFVSLPYHGPDVPALHTTSQTQLAQLMATKFHAVDKPFTHRWVASSSDPQEKVFYPTNGTAAARVIPDMGGIYALTVLNNGATASGTYLGVLLVSYGITCRQFRLQ
jgi:hypothetical protein